MHALNVVDEFGFRPFEDIDALNREIEAHIAEHNKKDMPCQTGCMYKL